MVEDDIFSCILFKDYMNLVIYKCIYLFDIYFYEIFPKEEI